MPLPWPDDRGYDKKKIMRPREVTMGLSWRIKGSHLFLVPLTVLFMTGLVRAEPFAKDFTWKEITFQVRSDNKNSDNTVTITADGKGIRPGPLTIPVPCPVTWAEITNDLDQDGSPELYVYATCPDTSPVQAGPGTSSPQPAVIATVSPEGGSGSVVPVIPAGTLEPGSAVIVGPGVSTSEGGMTLHALPVLPVQPDAPSSPHILELKFTLEQDKGEKTLHLTGQRAGTPQ